MKSINFLLYFFYIFFLLKVFYPLQASGSGYETVIEIYEPVLVDSSFNLYETGTIYLSGQPARRDFAGLQEKGVTLVINIRTVPEIEEYNIMLFNEQEYVESLNMSYLNAGVGGDAGFRPEVISQIAEAIGSAEGKVLIHCGSAGRASLVWMAWLVRYQGYKIDEAVRLGKIARFTFPFEELLGFDLTMKKAKRVK